MKQEASEQALRFIIRSVSGVHVSGSGNGDASQDDGEDEDTNTSEERLPLTDHVTTLRRGSHLTGTRTGPVDVA